MKLKKLASVILASMLAMSFAACGGASDDEIVVVSREEGSGTRSAFEELTGVEETGTTEEAIIQSSTDAIMTQVAGNEYAIGYVSLGSLNDTVKAVKVDGVEATVDNIKAGSYTVSRPFNIATKGELSTATQDFINFIMSAEGQAVVTDNKYIPVDDAAAAYAKLDGAEGKIAISGSSSVTPVMEKLKEAYEKVNPDVTIEVQQSDSSSGMKDAMEGISDIGMASRELKDSETAELTGKTIALDGIAVIVNKENEVDDLALDDIKGIYTGDILNWSEIGE